MPVPVVSKKSLIQDAVATPGQTPLAGWLNRFLPHDVLWD
jgi:hypothetical protein